MNPVVFSQMYLCELMDVCVHTYSYIHTSYVYTNVYMCMYLCVCVCVCVYLYFLDLANTHTKKIQTKATHFPT